jgi:hypothetical protein
MLNEAILLEQNRRLRERVDELEETVRQLLEEAPAPDLPPGLPYLTRSEETILRALLSARGLTTRDRLYAALYQHDEDRDPQIVVVMISRLRKKLAGLVNIETVWGRGYNANLIHDLGTISGGPSAGDQSETLAA